MWRKFSGLLLRNKLVFTLTVVLATVYIGYQASKMELSYEFAKILPENDPTFIEYQNFKKQFGEDGNVMVLGFEDKNFFTLNKFNDWYHLSKAIKIINGIKEVLSVPTAYKLKLNDSLSKFEFVPLITKIPRTQLDVDSIKMEVEKLKFYEGIIYNKETGATLMAITFNNTSLNSKRRLDIVKEIKTLTESFGEKHNLQLHYSGMPYIRSQMMEKISHEMTLFLVLAILITGLILWLFFRSGITVFFSLLIVAIGVVWSVGILELYGYKITVLTGLLAPLIMVIGVPNCIFLINKYQGEFILHGNKIKALSRMIETIGVTLFLANVTTAIGFGVLYFTKSSMLVEFGVVAAIGVMVTYFITLVLVPVMLYLLPEPKAKHTKHLEGKRITKILSVIDNLVQTRRKAIYITTIIVTALGVIGMFKISFIGYVVDDLPKKDPVYTDLHFFESAFKGVLPFEISIDTKKENGVFAQSAKVLYKMKALQGIFAGYKEFSKPVSVVEAIKFSYQSYKGGDPKYYRLPSIDDLKTLSDYSGTLSGQNNKLKLFIDSAKSITRISFQMADIGSKRIKELVAEIRPKVDSIFNPKEYEVHMTGHSLVFLKSNDYLLYNLMESLIIEILLIAIVGMALFRSVRIIILSKLPCLIPLIITAGVMGFLDIRFKPSTILIFSIAFGISSDGTIYFLTKYRQELRKKGGDAFKAISEAIKDTGLSMVYTSIILFFGFSIFSVSSFGGTAALGVLISLTLIMSLITNLVLLPAILLSIANKQHNKEIMKQSIIEVEE
ncbi:MAG: MMPL family transporter [Sphingobacteriaceae bacterium]|nr:MMPL family transporter [Sphingobacteriaceae bacterium]